MTLIAESGATKTDWALLSSETVQRVSGSGVNFSTMPPEAVRSAIGDALSSLGIQGDAVTRLFFYGAGLLDCPDILRELFPQAEIEAASDLLAAARALFGRSGGIAAILGTGSNSCLYNGCSMVRNIRSGGFILGDEGGGACLGKMFLSDLIKGLVPDALAEAFATEHEAGYGDIVRSVYRSDAPSAYLGSLAPWILSRAGDPYIDSLIEDNFSLFFSRALLRYGRPDLPVGIVGGLGCACREAVERVAAASGLRIEKFLRSPMDGLIDYHK